MSRTDHLPIIGETMARCQPRPAGNGCSGPVSEAPAGAFCKCQFRLQACELLLGWVIQTPAAAAREARARGGSTGLPRVHRRAAVMPRGSAAPWPQSGRARGIRGCTAAGRRGDRKPSPLHAEQGIRLRLPVPFASALSGRIPFSGVDTAIDRLFSDGMVGARTTAVTPEGVRRSIIRTATARTLV